jgi:hypothetical protein
MPRLQTIDSAEATLALDGLRSTSPPQLRTAVHERSLQLEASDRQAAGEPQLLLAGGKGAEVLVFELAEH